MKFTSIATRVGPMVILSVISVSAFFTAPAVSQDSRTMTVLGSIDGTVDGTERGWLTISGEVEGSDMASAAWRPHSDARAMENALGAMGEQQREQMKERLEKMAEMMGDDAAANPLAQMLGGDGEEKIALRIMGVDPDAEKILRQGGLTIELPPFSAENKDELLHGQHEAEISYHKNFGEKTGFHVSTHDVGTDAVVAFDQLEIVEGGGFAEGTFEGSLCPISALMKGSIDPEACILVAGRFETDLGEEETNSPASRSND
ncbi:hypothetical protein [Aquibaculum sediminis]|uniref:hypothetical protein n=1 Tax=Aquibaculum sediminis TaxID=3231907 RepID=UPI003457202A